MKKIITLLLSISMFMVVVACESPKEIVQCEKDEVLNDETNECETAEVEWQELLDAMEQLDQQESYLMTIEMFVDDELAASIPFTVIGTYMEYPISQYATARMIYQDGIWYSIDNVVGMPMLEPVSMDELSVDLVDIDEQITGSFTLQGEYYVSDDQEEGTTKFKVEDNLIVEIITEVEVEEITMNTIISFTDFNDVETEIPFYITVEQTEYMYEIMEDTTLYTGGSHLTYLKFYDNTGELEISCDPETKTCLIEYTEDYVYDPVANTIRFENASDTEPIEDFIASDENDVFNDSFFELIDYMFDLHQQTIESGYYDN